MMSEEMVCRKHRLSSFQIIILGFAGVILLGALLLMLPLSTTAGCVTPFHEALFTATSAVCVTGLVVQDTGSYWSVFGQAVILTLIQIGIILLSHSHYEFFCYLVRCFCANCFMGRFTRL